MPRCVPCEAAASDLRDLHDDIAADDPAAARRVLEDLRTAIHRLADHPGFGHLREGLADEALRVWTVHSSLVIYRPDGPPLQVVRVLSGERDLAALVERGRAPVLRWSRACTRSANILDRRRP